jgi:hypothetical protein
MLTRHEAQWIGEIELRLEGRYGWIVGMLGIAVTQVF